MGRTKLQKAFEAARRADALEAEPMASGAAADARQDAALLAYALGAADRLRLAAMLALARRGR
jgi:hypothetical protein